MKIYEWSPLFMADGGSSTAGGGYSSAASNGISSSPSNGGSANGASNSSSTGSSGMPQPGAQPVATPPGAWGTTFTPQDLMKSGTLTIAETPEQKAARETAEAQDYAKTQAGIASEGAGQQAVGYARSSGLNPAQAALLGSTSAGNTYGTSYGTNLYNRLGLDVQKYGIDTQRYGIDKNAEVQKYNADLGYKAQKNQIDQQNNNNLWGALGTGVSAIGGIFSDENLKEDIKDGYGILDRVTRVVNPKTFKIKPEAGGDGKTQVGVMAQDLEKTPLASTVVDTPQGKVVDTRKLTTANTAMLSDLSKKVDTLYNFLKEASGGPARAS